MSYSASCEYHRGKYMIADRKIIQHIWTMAKNSQIIKLLLILHSCHCSAILSGICGTHTKTNCHLSVSTQATCGSPQATKSNLMSWSSLIGLWWGVVIHSCIWGYIKLGLNSDHPLDAKNNNMNLVCQFKAERGHCVRKYSTSVNV